MFHVTEGLAHQAHHFDAALDRLGLSVDDGLEAQLAAAPDDAARFGVLGDELGLRIDDAQNVTGADTPDTLISFDNQAGLLLVDYDDDFSFAQIDIL